jgi:hypothetical protein
VVPAAAAPAGCQRRPKIDPFRLGESPPLEHNLDLLADARRGVAELLMALDEGALGDERFGFLQRLPPPPRRRCYRRAAQQPCSLLLLVTAAVLPPARDIDIRV